MKKVNKTNMRAFKKWCEKEFGVDFIGKNSAVYGMVQLAVRALGVDADKIDRWLDRWAITLGRFIWLPYRVGEGNRSALVAQIENMTHELRHSVQWKKDRARFAVRYSFSRSKRTAYECEALAAEMEVAYAFGTNPDYSEMAGKLKSYMVRKSDIAVAKKRLRIYDKTARTGARTDEVAKKVCRWWGV